MFMFPAIVAALSSPSTAVYPREPSLESLLIPQSNELVALRFMASRNVSVSQLPPDLIGRIISDHTSIDRDELQNVMEGQLQSRVAISHHHSDSLFLSTSFLPLTLCVSASNEPKSTP